VKSGFKSEMTTSFESGLAQEGHFKISDIGTTKSVCWLFDGSTLRESAIVERMLSEF